MEKDTKLIYEWSIEFSNADGDIEDATFGDTLSELPGNALDCEEGCELVLIRTVYDDYQQTVKSRGWAYLEAGQLPAQFDCGNKVPKRFRDELAAYAATQQQKEGK